MPRFALLEHHWDGIHWDLMLDDGSVLRTWAIDAPIEEWGRALPALLCGKPRRTPAPDVLTSWLSDARAWATRHEQDAAVKAVDVGTLVGRLFPERAERERRVRELIDELRAPSTK